MTKIKILKLLGLIAIFLFFFLLIRASINTTSYNIDDLKNIDFYEKHEYLNKQLDKHISKMDSIIKTI
jgi:sensor domain CHASE-containing protein